MRHFFDGQEGECLFTFPFSSVSDTFRHNQEIEPLYKKIENSTDDRSTAIISAIIVEYLIDKLLDNYLPAYNDHNKKHKKDSFWYKQELLFSSNLIPSHITDCIQLIGVIRNKFAHNLEIDSFKKIGKDLNQQMRHCISKVPIYNRKSPTDSKKLFKQIQFVAITGLSVYYINIKILNEYIHSHKCLEQPLLLNEQENKILLEYIGKFGRTIKLDGGGKVTVFNEKDYQKFRIKKFHI